MDEKISGKEELELGGVIFGNLEREYGEIIFFWKYFIDRISLGRNDLGL